MVKKVFLVGRPNVGKSTFFNIFAHKKAIVYNQPGVTRDIKSEKVSFNDYSFELLDTPGIEKETQKRVRIQEADLILFMVDGTAGCTPSDLEIAKWLRKSGREIIVLMNKCDRKDFDATPFYPLGFKNIIPVSSAHKIGLFELTSFLENYGEAIEEKSLRHKVAIMGRPNSGKSTLINVLLGKEYQLTGPTPGLTRDSVSFDIDFRGTPFTFIDTAGVRKKGRINEVLEKMCVSQAIESMKEAEGVLYLIDGTSIDYHQGLDHQDMTMIGEITQSGRCLVIAISKWDVVQDKKKILEEIRALLDQKISGIPCITISSLHNQGIQNAIHALSNVLEKRKKRISTGMLNRWLQTITEKTPPPSLNGRAVKMKYMSQTDDSPPEFTFFINRYTASLEQYKRFLLNNIRKEFDFEGVPIKIVFKLKKNPYVTEQKFGTSKT